MKIFLREEVATIRTNGAAIIVFAMALTTLLACVFLLPYAVPVSSRVISASTLAGFNNAAAYLLYVALLVPTSTLLLLALKSIPLPQTELWERPLRWLPTRIVWAVLICHVVIFASLFSIKGHIAFADGVYFQHILARMVEGAVPYRDVNFLYGPGMLYPAFWLTSYLNVMQAYFVYYVLSYLIGLYVLYLCVQVVAGKAWSVDGLYVLCALGLFNSVLGLNYVFIRFLLPAVTLAIVSWDIGRPRFVAFILAVAALYLTFVYSLEMGILTVLGMCTLIGVAVFRGKILGLLGPIVVTEIVDRATTSWRESPDSINASFASFLRVGGICLFAVTGVILTFWTIDPTFSALAGYVKPMLAYNSGGGNRPLIPSLPLLGLIFISAGVLTLCIRTAMARGFDNLSALLIALVVSGLVMERAAFGKPDVLHIAYSGSLVLLLGFAALSIRLSGIPLKTAYALSVLVTIVIPLQFFNLLIYSRIPNHEVGVKHSVQAPVSRRAIEAGLDRMITRFGSDKPYYLHTLGYYSLPVVTNRHVKQVPYLVTLEEAFTDEDIQNVIEELRNSQAIVITLRNNMQPSGQIPTKKITGALYELIAVPTPGSIGFARTVRANDHLRRSLIEFINACYSIASEDGDLVALTLMDVRAHNPAKTHDSGSCA